MTFWYMASPYSRFPGGIDLAHAIACEQAALLVKNGIPTFCPIAHSHPICLHSGLDAYDHDIWLAQDEAFWIPAKGLIVCKMKSWEQSYGIKKEIEWFTEHNKPIVYMEPNHVPEGLI